MVVQEFARYVPGKNAMDSNVDARVESSVAVERRQQGVNRAFVRSNRDFAALKPVQLLDSFADFLFEIQHSLGVFEQQDAGIRQVSRSGAADEQGLPDPILELSHRNTHSRLGAVEFFGRPGKTVFASHRLKHVKRRQIHGSSPSERILLHKCDLFCMQQL